MGVWVSWRSDSLLFSCENLEREGLKKLGLLANTARILWRGHRILLLAASISAFR